MEKFEGKNEEKSLRDVAVEAIKFFGINHKDAKAALDKWREEEDREISSLEEEERLDAEIHSIIYEAEIYFEAGEKSIALEHLRDAATMALTEKMHDTAILISDKLQEFSKS